MAKKQKQLLRGMELMVDDLRIKDHLLENGKYPDDLPEGDSEYFLKYGFRVPNYISTLYEKFNGMSSAKYISTSLYYYTIYPFLVNKNLSMAYIDKNSYTNHFPISNLPRTIVHNVNNKFFTDKSKEFLKLDDVLKLLKNEKEFIIKPAIDTGCGRDVRLVSGCQSNESLVELLKEYNSDFIIQEKVSQSPEMAKFNSSSFNTYRIYTYLPVDEKEYVVLGSCLRFGGEGDHRDNASSGGGFCKVNQDGYLDDVIYRYSSYIKGSLIKEKGFSDLKAPFYNQVVDFCLNLHYSMPYMDLIGWDIGIDNQGNLILIEINETPDCEFFQIANGPMFGEYTDKLMEAVKNTETQTTTGVKRLFPYKPHHNYNFEIGKKNSL